VIKSMHYLKLSICLLMIKKVRDFDLLYADLFQHTFQGLIQFY